MTTAAVNPEDLASLKNMRDIHDYCTERGIPSLAQGMIEFPPPKRLRQLASEIVVEDGVHTYRPRFGVPQYLESLCRLMKRLYGEEVSPDSVLAAPGVAGGVVAGLLTMQERHPKGTVALMEPYYTYHVSQVERVFQRSPAVIPSTGANAEPDFAELRRRVEAGEVQGVIATNPVNPTGRVYTQAEVDLLVGLSESHGLFVVFDECYVDMVFAGRKSASPLVGGTKRNVVVCRGFSKNLGTQSWRCGYAVSAKETVADMMRLADPFYICVNWTQHAMARFFDEEPAVLDEHVRDLNALLESNWRLLKDAFQRRFGWEPLDPEGTMYGMFRHKEDTDMKAAGMAIQAGVGVCPGNIFFGDQASPTPCTGWIRIHCGVAREKAELIAATLGAKSPQ